MHGVDLFRLVSFCFDTGLFVSVVSVKVRITKTNRKIFFWFRQTNRKTTKTEWVSVCFGLNRKYYLFVCFEGTLRPCNVLNTIFKTSYQQLKILILTKLEESTGQQVENLVLLSKNLRI